MATEATAVQLRTATDDPRVVEIFDEFAEICRRHDRSTGELMTALLMTAVSAVKSFGIHPREFVEQFERVYERTRQPDVIPVDPERTS